MTEGYTVKDRRLWYPLGMGEKIDPSMHHDSLSSDSGSILRISESILSFVFNQMCDDAEFALETQILLASNSSHTYTTLTFRKIIFHISEKLKRITRTFAGFIAQDAL